MRALKFAVILFALSTPSWAEEAVFSSGADGQASIPGFLPAAIEPWIKAEGDTLIPLSDEASVLLQAEGRVGYALPDSFLDWLGKAEASFSWRGERWFWKAGARGEGEGETLSGEADFAISALAAVSYDFNAFTLAFAPTLRWSTDAGLPLGIYGDLNATMPAGDEVVLRTVCKAGVEGPGFAEWFLEGKAGFTWYSPALVVLSADGGYKRRVSPLAETAEVDGAAVTIPQADDYHEMFLTPEISFAPGKSILITARAPAWFRLWNHGIVGDGTIIPSTEWAIGASPAGSVRFDVSESFALKASAGADLILTNSAYREGSSAYLSVEGVLTLGGR